MIAHAIGPKPLEPRARDGEAMKEFCDFAEFGPVCVANGFESARSGLKIFLVSGLFRCSFGLVFVPISAKGWRDQFGVATQTAAE
jgi:hypothetical protein